VSATTNAVRFLLAGLAGLALGCLVFVVGPRVAFAQDPAEFHGFVDPCAVQFVQDGTNHCELCSRADGDAERCIERVRELGYERKCRTSVHSTPGEVWCISESREKALRYQRIALMLGAVLAGLGVFLIARRRRARRARPNASAERG
jgi:hypothetical protein